MTQQQQQPPQQPPPPPASIDTQYKFSDMFGRIRSSTMRFLTLGYSHQQAMGNLVMEMDRGNAFNRNILGPNIIFQNIRDKDSKIPVFLRSRVDKLTSFEPSAKYAIKHGLDLGLKGKAFWLALDKKNQKEYKRKMFMESGVSTRSPRFWADMFQNVSRITSFAVPLLAAPVFGLPAAAGMIIGSRLLSMSAYPLTQIVMSWGDSINGRGYTLGEKLHAITMVSLTSIPSAIMMFPFADRITKILTENFGGDLAKNAVIRQIVMMSNSMASNTMGYLLYDVLYLQSRKSITRTSNFLSNKGMKLTDIDKERYKRTGAIGRGMRSSFNALGSAYASHYKLIDGVANTIRNTPFVQDVADKVDKVVDYTRSVFDGEASDPTNPAPHSQTPPVDVEKFTGVPTALTGTLSDNNLSTYLDGTPGVPREWKTATDLVEKSINYIINNTNKDEDIEGVFGQIGIILDNAQIKEIKDGAISEDTMGELLRASVAMQQGSGKYPNGNANDIFKNFLIRANAERGGTVVLGYARLNDAPVENPYKTIGSILSGNIENIEADLSSTQGYIWRNSDWTEDTTATATAVVEVTPVVTTGDNTETAESNNKGWVDTYKDQLAQVAIGFGAVIFLAREGNLSFTPYGMLLKGAKRTKYRRYLRRKNIPQELRDTEEKELFKMIDAKTFLPRGEWMGKKKEIEKAEKDYEKNFGSARRGFLNNRVVNFFRERANGRGARSRGLVEFHKGKLEAMEEAVVDAKKKAMFDQLLQKQQVYEAILKERGFLNRKMMREIRRELNKSGENIKNIKNIDKMISQIQDLWKYRKNLLDEVGAGGVELYMSNFSFGIKGAVNKRYQIKKLRDIKRRYLNGIDVPSQKYKNRMVIVDDIIKRLQRLKKEEAKRRKLAMKI